MVLPTHHIVTFQLGSDSEEELYNDVFIPNPTNKDVEKAQETLPSPYTDAAILAGKVLVAACVCYALYSIIRHDSSTSIIGNIDDHLP